MLLPQVTFGYTESLDEAKQLYVLLTSFSASQKWSGFSHLIRVGPKMVGKPCKDALLASEKVGNTCAQCTHPTKEQL